MLLLPDWNAVSRGTVGTVWDEDRLWARSVPIGFRWGFSSHTEPGEGDAEFDEVGDIEGVGEPPLASDADEIIDWEMTEECVTL